MIVFTRLFFLSMLTKNCILAALLTLLSSTAALLFAQPHAADVLSVVQTLQSLRDYEQDGRPESQRITFELPEAIVNLYLTTSLSVTPRPALKSLKVEILPGNRLIAVGDLDWERLLQGDESLVPAKLREQLIDAGPLKAAFTFRVESGFVTFTVNAVPSGGVQIPDAVLRGIVRRVAQSQPKSSTRPNQSHYRLACGPFPRVKRCWSAEQDCHNVRPPETRRGKPLVRGDDREHLGNGTASLTVRRPDFIST